MIALAIHKTDEFCKKRTVLALKYFPIVALYEHKQDLHPMRNSEHIIKQYVIMKI